MGERGAAHADADAAEAAGERGAAGAEDAAGEPAAEAPAGAAPGPPRGLSLRVAGPGRPTSLVVSWLAPEHLGESPVHAYDVEVAAGELGPCDARWGQAGAAWAVDVTSTPGGLQELSVVVVLAARARGASLSGRVRARNRHGVGAWLQTSCGAPAPAQDCGEAPALQLRGCLLAVSQQGQLSWDAPPGLRGALFQFSLWECPGAATSNMRMRRVLTEQMDLGAPKLLRLTSATRERFPMAKGASYIGEVLALEPGVGCRSLAVAMCLSLACEPRRPVSVPAAASKEQVRAVAAAEQEQSAFDLVRAEQMGAEVTFASPPAEQIVKMPLLSLTVQPLVERAGEAAPLEAPIECSAEPMSGNFQTGDLLPREADPCAEQVTPLQLNCAPGQLLDLTEPPVQQGLLDAVVLDLTEPLVQHGPLDAIATEAAPPGVAPSEARELPRLAPQGPARAEAASALRVFGATRGADAHGAPLGLRVARVWPEGAEVRWRGPAALWLLRLQDAASGLSRVEATELGCQGLGVRCEEALEWRHEFHDLRPGRTYVVGILGHDDHVTLRTPSGDPVACVPWARVKEVGARVVELEWGAAADDAGEYQVSVRSSGGIAPGDVARVELLRQREACTKQSYCVQDLRPDTKYDFELWFSKGGVRSSECISLTAATCSECAEPAPVDDHGTMTDARWEMRASDACLDSSAAELNSVRRRAYDRFQLLVCMLMVILHVSNVALELQRADADFSEERVLVATVAVALPWMLNAVICWVFYQVCRELSTIEDGMVGFRQWLVDNSRLAGCIWILSVMHSGCLNLFKFYMPQRVFDATERASVQNFDHLLLQALRSKAEAEELCGEYARMLAALQGRPAPKPAPARRAAAADVLLAERTPARGAAAEGRLCEVHTPPRPALAWPAPWSPPGGPPQSPPPPADAPEGASASPGAPDHLWGFAVMTPGTVAPEPALAAPAAPCALREAARRPREGDHVAAAAGPPRLEASPTHAALPPPPRLAEAGEGASPAAQEQGAGALAPLTRPPPAAAWQPLAPPPALGPVPRHCLLCGQGPRRLGGVAARYRWLRCLAAASAALYRDVPQLAVTVYLWSTVEESSVLADAIRAANVSFTTVYLLLQLVWLADSLAQLRCAARAMPDEHLEVTAVEVESGHDWVKVSWAAFADSEAEVASKDEEWEFRCTLRPVVQDAPASAAQVAVVPSSAVDPATGRAAWTFRGLSPDTAFEATVAPARRGRCCAAGGGQLAWARTGHGVVELQEQRAGATPPTPRSLRVLRYDARSATLEWEGDASPSTIHAVTLLPLGAGRGEGGGATQRAELAAGCRHELRGLEPGTAYLVEVGLARRAASCSLRLRTPHEAAPAPALRRGRHLQGLGCTESTPGSVRLRWQPAVLGGEVVERYYVSCELAGLQGFAGEPCLVSASAVVDGAPAALCGRCPVDILGPGRAAEAQPWELPAQEARGVLARASPSS